MLNCIGNRIFEARKRKNLTQQELANKLYLSKSAISCFETGVSTPSANTLYKLCVALDVKVDCLLGLDNRTWICVDLLDQFEIELIEQIVISLRCKTTI